MRTFIATYVANRYAKAAVAAIMKAARPLAARRNKMEFEGRPVTCNLLIYKIKKIVAEHGYLNKSMLTPFELKQLGHTKGRLVEIFEKSGINIWEEGGCGYPGLPENGKQS